jgi:hypothetical protein
MSKRAVTNYLPWITCIALTMTPSPSPAVCYHAPPAEVVSLPKFCWAQYCVPNAQGPQYQIPISDCGYYMNHYCPSLIYLNQGMKSNGNARLQNLVRAKEGIVYTVNHMKQYPHCPIRAHAEASLREVDTLLRITPGQ